ncbi:hypothetical protein [Flagellimonas sp. CMM7]|uniref:hypothetical protein n=1 Tax=Flagellimonas sp. CMM7 TaxID=2654676 RepID=UPI0013D64BC3|nr:hypothetical protein [Flagellimonas sp. CMM7]UII79690.1 hypothetical protein LV704_18765 [Flagellimonas sp. CMM7]
MKNFYITILFFTVFFTCSSSVNAQYHTYDRNTAIEREKQDTQKKKTSTKKKTTTKKTTTKNTTSKTEEPFNFDITFNNMQVLLDMQKAINIAQRKKIDEWLKKQESKFLKEINRQLGTKHSTFSTAQKDFFKNYEKNLRGVERSANKLVSSHSNKSKTYDKEQETYTNEFNLIDEWRLIKAVCAPRNGPGIECDLFNKTIRGTRLGTASTASLNQLWDKILVDFSKKEYESALNKAWARGISKIVSDGSLSNEMANKHVTYYRQRGLQDKIFFMTTYLTQYNNRHLPSVLKPYITKYNPPNFWSNNTLLDMGKKKAPALTDSEKIFQRYFFENEAERCINSTSSVQQSLCAKNYDRLIDLREEVILDHMEDLSSNSEFGLTRKLTNIREGFRKGNGGGKIGGLDALSYRNWILDDNGSNRFYELNNGGWVYRSNSPRKGINGGNSFSEPSLNDDGFYYYIYNEELKNWHEILLPAKGVDPNSDPFLAVAFWDVMKGVGRYALPFEDVIILIDGKDFDGNEVSQAEAGIFLVIGFIPGGKVFKPVFKVVKGAKVFKIVTRQGARTIITNLEKLTTLFKSGTNKSFFWSGKTNGVGGATRALEIAKSKGGTTLEGLIDSKKIELPNWDLSNPQSLEAWKEVSKIYAEQASGEVRAIIGKDLRTGSVWEVIELPALKANKKVTKIITIDPLTLQEKVIFIR